MSKMCQLMLIKSLRSGLSDGRVEDAVISHKVSHQLHDTLAQHRTEGDGLPQNVPQSATGRKASPPIKLV